MSTQEPTRFRTPNRRRQITLPLAAGIFFACSSDDGDGTTPPADGGPGQDMGGEAGDPVVRGEELYRHLRCANCHGLDGQGSPNFPGAPTLLGRTVEDLTTAIINPCEMVTAIGGCHPLKLPDLNPANLEDITKYLAALESTTPRIENPGPACDDVPGNICTLMGNGVSGHVRREGILARKQFMFWPQNVNVDPQGRVIATDWNNYIYKRIEKEGCEPYTDDNGKMGMDCPLSHVIGTSDLGDSCSPNTGNPILASNSGMNHPVGMDFLDNTFPGWEGSVILYGWHQWKIKYIPVIDGEYGEMFCVWGNGRGFSGDGNPAGTGMGMGPTQVAFNLPSSAVWDREGNFYISDQANLRIRVVRRDADDVDAPGKMWAVSRRNNVVRTWAGGEPVTSGGGHNKTDIMYTNSGDGLAVSATVTTFRVQFGFDALPQMRLAMDRPRNFMYVADAENGRIRRIDLNLNPPIITTVAGCAGTGAPEMANCTTAGTNVPALQARLKRAGDVDVFPDGSGDLLITDAFNHCMRVVQFSTGKIHTVAGKCGVDPASHGYAGDGGPATQALLDEPGGAGVGPDRAIYIADTLNHRIRKVNPMPLPQ